VCSSDLPAQSYSVIFANPGVFPYLCFIHPWMAGVISVGLPGVPAPVGPLPDVVQGTITADAGRPNVSGSAPGVGEICVAAQFEAPPDAAAAGLAGVIHCLDASTFQDLPLATFDADPRASLRTLTASDVTDPSLVGRKIGGRFEGVSTVHDMWVSNDGKTMWATLWHGGSFVTIDRMTNTVTQQTFVAPAADVAHVQTAPSGDVGFLTLEGGPTGQLAIFNPLTSEVKGFIPFNPEDHPHGMWICGDGSIMVTALPLSNRVGFTNVPSSPVGQGSQRGSALAVGLYPAAVGTLTDCSKSYTSNALSNSIGVYDVRAGTWMHNVDLPLCLECTLMGLPFPVGSIALQTPPSPDNRYIVVNLAKAAKAAIIDTTTDTVISIADCGSGCHGSAYGPKRGGGFYWWGSMQYQDKVAVVDMETLTKAGDVPLNVRSILTLQGLTPLGCPTCMTVSPGQAGGQGVVTFPLPPPWVQPVVLR